MPHVGRRWAFMQVESLHAEEAAHNRINPPARPTEPATVLQPAPCRITVQGFQTGRCVRFCRPVLFLPQRESLPNGSSPNLSVYSDLLEKIYLLEG
jgi:hypothetical protein